MYLQQRCPSLSTRMFIPADEVYGVDCSPALIELARRVNPQAHFSVADVASEDAAAAVPRGHLCLLANVLISPDAAIVGRILATAWSRVLPGGYLVVLVPSAESAQLVCDTARAAQSKGKRCARERWRDFVVDPAEAAAHGWRRWGVATYAGFNSTI